jgi:hypothetical protein
MKDLWLSPESGEFEDVMNLRVLGMQLAKNCKKVWLCLLTAVAIADSNSMISKSLICYKYLTR